MTKNQINYLLVLATLVVVWLYFNTFVMGAMALKRNAGGGRSAVPMIAGGQAPYFPGAYGNRDPRTGMPSLDDIRKMAEAKMPAPAPAVPEKKQ